MATQTGGIDLKSMKKAHDQAYSAASSAQTSADAAQASADAAQVSADEAEGHAQTALTNAGLAQTAANDAQASADSALVSLSTVEDVVGTLNWITAHGTMTSQYGETFDAGTVYFVMDDTTPGDYHVGSHYYSVVSQPVAEDIDSYYCLSVDESVQNYVATHIVVDSEGLWIVPDSGGNKVLIAVGGSGHTYDTTGTYVIGKVNNIDTVLACFTSEGAKIGQNGQSRMELDYHSMRMVDIEGNTFLHVSDIRDANGNVQAMATGDGTTKTFRVEDTIAGRDSVISVKVNGADTEYSVSTFGSGSEYFTITFSTAPTSGATISIVYAPYHATQEKAYTLGMRGDGNIGRLSLAEGNGNIATALCSHAEGLNTSAVGPTSHTEGNSTEASSGGAHAEGYRSKAKGDYSHAEGRGSYATKIASHAEGDYTEATAIGAHSEGSRCKSAGAEAHAEGLSSEARTEASHAEGQDTFIDSYDSETYFGIACHTEGCSTKLYGCDYAHAEGYDCLSMKAKYSHTGGYRAGSFGAGAFAHGSNVKSCNAYNTVIGKYNVATSTQDNVTDEQIWSASDLALTIGNGTANNARSNALTVDWDGRIECGDYSGNLKSIFDLFYPVGSYYETSLPSAIPSGSSTPTAADLATLGSTWFNPKYAWGGEWSLESAGKFHVSAGTNYSVGATGGSANAIIPYHRHNVAAITEKITGGEHDHGSGTFATNSKGSHSHEPYNTDYQFMACEGTSSAALGRYQIKQGTGSSTTHYFVSSATAVGRYNATESAGAHTHDVTGTSGKRTHKHDLPQHYTDYVGTSGNTTGANMPPYIAVNRWHRTA